jgi:membrane-bound serine protease (ClpP class)
MIEEVLLNPNVAYLILVAAALVTILAILSPGTGILEITALFLLILSGYTVFRLPVNYWALGVLVLGVIPFLLALRRSRKTIFLILAIGALLLGSIFLFSSQGWQPAVNPILAAVVSISLAGFVWLIAQKALEAEGMRPSHDLETLIGAIGEAKTEINDEGSVQIEGELWSAQSEQAIPLGAKVRVVSREGFFLKVEPV